MRAPWRASRRRPLDRCRRVLHSFSVRMYTDFEGLPMTLTERLLGSKALAALTSPHGVDRYLEMVNPMWAATEVRARVVDVVRETDGVADGAAPVATITLQPTS